MSLCFLKSWNEALLGKFDLKHNNCGDWTGEELTYLLSVSDWKLTVRKLTLL